MQDVNKLSFGVFRGFSLCCFALVAQLEQFVFLNTSSGDRHVKIITHVQTIDVRSLFDVMRIRIVFCANVVLKVHISNFLC